MASLDYQYYLNLFKGFMMAIIPIWNGAKFQGGCRQSRQDLCFRSTELGRYAECLCIAAADRCWICPFIRSGKVGESCGNLGKAPKSNVLTMWETSYLRNLPFWDGERSMYDSSWDGSLMFIIDFTTLCISIAKPRISILNIEMTFGYIKVAFWVKFNIRRANYLQTSLTGSQLQPMAVCWGCGTPVADIAVTFLSEALFFAGGWNMC